MKTYIFISTIIFASPSLYAKNKDLCVNRTVSVELKKEQVDSLKSNFSIQSNLPYTFKVRNKNKLLSIVDISYRRKGPKDEYAEPVNPNLFKDVADRLSNQYESLGIKKMSAQFIPGECL